MKKIAFIFVIVFFMTSNIFGQCNWRNIDTLAFESSTVVDTSIVPTSCYHTKPQTWGVHTGTYGLYFNIQTGVPVGTLLYHRTFTVCPGNLYNFSFYYTTAFANTLCNITVNLWDGPTLINTITSGNIPVQNWQQYVSPNFTPTTNTIKLEIITNVAGSANGNDLAVDDMVLKNCSKYYSDTLFMCNGNLNYNLYDSIPSAVLNNTTYTWSGPSALTNGYLGTFNPNNNTNGNYVYTYVTGSNRCYPDSFVINTNTINCNLPCPTMTISNDTSVCNNALVQLNASLSSGTIQSCTWLPTANLSNSNIVNPVATINGPITYHATILSQSTINLIANGDFSAGNASFSSAYTYTSSTVPPPGCVTSWGILSCPGFYTITTTPSSAHTNFSSFGDHTTGSGNMYVCNGATNPNISVWCQTVVVTPNTNYNLSAWVTNVDPFSSAASLAILSFNVNGTNIGTSFSPNVAPGSWSNPSTVWNSGANTVANICIQNQATFAGGNDFALDDIVFSPLCTITDSVTISMGTTPTVTLPADSSFCNSVSLNINSNVTGIPTPTYQWQNGASTTSFNATAAGTYWLNVSNGCGSDRDSIIIAMATSPTSVDLGPTQYLCNQSSYTITPTIVGSALGLQYKWQDSSTNATFNATTSGTYFVRVYNGCGSVWDTVRIYFNNSPTVDLGPTLNLCNQTQVTLSTTVTGTAPLNYKWQDSSTNSIFVANTTGLYYVRVYNMCGSVWDTVKVNFYTSPTVDLGLAQSLCNTASVTLNPFTTGSGPLNYKWQDSSTNASFVATTSAVYFVRVYNMCGSVTDTVRLTFNTSPNVNLGRDTLICDLNSYTIMPVVTGSTPLNYLWANGTINTTLTVSTPGTYILAVSNMCGTDRDSIIVDFKTSPTITFASHNYTICEDQILSLTPVITGSPMLNYLWSTNEITPSITPTVSGNYTLTVSNVCKSVSDVVSVIIVPNPIKVLPADKTLCIGDNLILDALNIGATYLWNTGETSQKISVNETGLYSVEIGNQNLCYFTDSIYVEFNDCSPGYIFIPNAFSPNGDGINDKIFPIIIGENAHLQNFSVYNRWGQLLFATDIQNDGWDGYFHGKLQPQEVYVYSIRWTQFDTSKVTKGDITLIH